MLFNSAEFILVFLPITLFVFFFVGSGKTLFFQRMAIGWLLLASLFFYSWWNPYYLLLLLTSIVSNYFIGSSLEQRALFSNTTRKLFLTIGIFFNLGLIAYFKYSNFFVDTVNQLFGQDYYLQQVILPLAISFFTFQQIAYLVDSYRGKTKSYGFLRYCLFVSFFPQLIAGPIVHHKDVLPQFSHESTYRLNLNDFSVGLTIFILGLSKKVLLADTVSVYAQYVFKDAANGAPIPLIDGWVGALAYTLQLYFDFSGYSDMAIGAARLFGIRIPINFNSPYKAISIIDFWRRWHITLSNFLRDYLYIPLGGSYKGGLRRGINLFITMLLGGLWHGAGWTFIFWGGLHGIFLIINHKWNSFLENLRTKENTPSPIGIFFGWATTFLAVIVGWVIFRSESMSTAFSILQGMINFNELSSSDSPLSQLLSMRLYATILLLLIIALFAPNSQEWINESKTIPHNTPEKKSTYCNRLAAIAYRFRWQPNKYWGLVIGALFFLALKNILTAQESEFLYFDF